MRKNKKSTHAAKKARNGSIRKRKSKGKRENTSLKILKRKNSSIDSSTLENNRTSELTTLSHLTLVSVFRHSAHIVLDYVEKRVELDSKSLSESCISFNYHDLDTTYMSNMACGGPERGKSAILNYYQACILDAAPNSEMKLMLSKMVKKGIIDLYNDLLPMESEKEIYEYLNSALSTVCGEEYSQIKKFIEDVAKNKNINNGIYFDTMERSTLQSLINHEFSFEIQIYCFNMYLNYLIYSNLGDHILEQAYKIEFGYEWDKFKKEYELEVNRYA
jgi:hypothetical protein